MCSARNGTTGLLMALVGYSWWTKPQLCWIPQWKTCNDFRYGGHGYT